MLQKCRNRPYEVGLLWKEYFRDPTQWWDNRTSKTSPSFPDFKHKVTRDPLWIDGRCTPSWVHEELKREQGTDDGNTVLGNGLKAEETYFVGLLRACARTKDLRKGSIAHADLQRGGFLEKSFLVGDALVNMYAKCGAVAKAQEVLDGLPARNVFTWTALIAGYAQQGQGEKALSNFDRMRGEGIAPDAATFACILKACGSTGNIGKGELVHDEIGRRGLLRDNIVLRTALVGMYAKCGALAKARQVLEEIPSRDAVSWNALMAGYAQQGRGEEVLNCFEHMQGEGLSPNAVTIACVLKACGSIGGADKVEQLLDKIVRQGLLGKDIVLGSALVDLYAKCGALVKARRVFEEISTRDVVSWNALIAGYAQNGQGEEALACFERMHEEGLPPNAVTFTCALQACGCMGAIDKGEQIHDETSRQALLGKDIVLGNALIDMYVKCHALAKAQKVLDELLARDVFSWSTLIAGYAQHGQCEEALNCFERMQGEGLTPNAVTFTCILKACGSIGAVDKGKRIHDEITRQGLLGNDIMLGNALVDMYAKCGSLGKARKVLKKLPIRDVVSWSALIVGYVEQGQIEEALDCFEEMQGEGVYPNEVTFAYALKACSSIGAANKGQQIHDEITKQGLLKKHAELGYSLVDMFAKCGALAKARQVLEELPSQNVDSWTALIGGYAQQGHTKDALDCFEKMQSEGVSPNAFTFSCVLNACSHSGLVDEGEMYFASMDTKHGIEPDVAHYTCMVDLYGRAGHLDRAVAVVQNMPSSDDCIAWLALLGACRKWQDVKIGRWAFEHAVRQDESDAAAYVLMANIYSAAGMKEEAEIIEAMRVKNKAWRKPGRSFWVASSGKVHSFSVGDTKHAQSKLIYTKLQDLCREMSQCGYHPNLQWVA
ncbi:hypothetical protein GOP47_0020297 [Adiantum capillus-veneris]|uniref:Pentatricopeptide repeat-containing protein n=1 Tax=Adiantum capillus-veneris TaxID=13818 RepID=A0A9D4Z9F1_ADICA|nr:hypothetical protein GOP47_0020297 [Adiantum capillus-veneris]